MNIKMPDAVMFGPHPHRALWGVQEFAKYFNIDMLTASPEEFSKQVSLGIKGKDPPINVSSYRHAALLHFVMLWALKKGTPFRDLHKMSSAKKLLEDAFMLGPAGSVFANMWAHISNFTAFGSRYYEVSPGLAQQLRHAELRGMPNTDLHLPFPSVYFIIPPQSGLRVWNAETEWHRCIGAYVQESQTPHELAIFLCGEPKPVWGRVGTHQVYTDNDAISYYTLNLELGSFEDTIAHFMKESGKDEVFGPMAKEWPSAINWLRNAIVYSTWPTAEKDRPVLMNRDAQLLWERIQKTQGAKRKKLSTRLKQYGATKKIVLGKSIVVQRGKEQLHELGPGKRSPLTVRILVSGHKKVIRCGKGNSERKEVWIDPYWKGPEDGLFSAPTHVLK
jgi:hypothetical protein